MATRDLTYLIDFDVEGAAELSTAATNLEELATAAGTIDEQASVDLILPQADEIDAVGTSLGELGRDGGPVDKASEKTGGLTGAFGQMVGAISLVQVAGHGLDFVMDKIREKQEQIAKVDAFDDAQVKAFAEAIREAGDSVTDLVDSLEGTQRITGIVEQTGDIVDITNDLANAGVTADEYFRVLDGGQESFDAFLGNLEDQGVSEESRNRIQLAGIDNLRNYEAGTLDAAASNEVFAESQQSANEALQALLAEQDPMSEFRAEWDILRQGIRDGSIDTQTGADALNTLADGLNLTTDQVLALAQADLEEAAAGAQAFADALNSIEFDNTDLAGATSAFSAYTDQLFAAGNQVQTTEAAFDALAASAEDQALTFDVGTEAGRAQQDALEGLSRALDTDLAQAYDAANGNAAVFQASAETIANETLTRLDAELDLTDEQLRAVAETMGLTPEQITTRFELAGIAEAQLQLGLLTGAIEGLPDDVEQEVNLLILEGDFVGARDRIASYYSDNPIPATVQIDPTQKVLAVEPVKIETTPDLAAFDEIDDAVDESRAATIDTTPDLAAFDEIDTAVAESRTADIDVNALLASFESEMTFATRDRNVDVNVGTGTIDMPSNTELRNQIGTIRVPIQLYYNQRIEGSRPI